MYAKNSTWINSVGYKYSTGLMYICQKIKLLANQTTMKLIFLKPIILGPNTEAVGKNTVLDSTRNYVCNVLKVIQKVDLTGTQY